VQKSDFWASFLKNNPEQIREGGKPQNIPTYVDFWSVFEVELESFRNARSEIKFLFNLTNSKIKNC
jgi:hypothetical protein